jgi:hypothetical protein
MTRRNRKQGRLNATALLAGACVLIVVLAGTLALLLTTGGDDSTDDGVKRAVIVDQLSLTNPSADFISEARGTLAAAGYTVEYVSGENVTVDTYRSLPDRGYDLVILRVHAGITTEIDAATGERTGTEYVSLFTGEAYDQGKYSEEQLNRLGSARYDENSDPLFGIGPAFIEDSMRGDFGGAVVIMMGCDGLRSQRTAEAFLNRGASAFVSWSKPISASHTDRATEALLERLLIDDLPIEDAVAQTAAEVGPDPVYEGELRILTS